MVESKPLALKYFKLWRAGQKKLGVSDENMRHATLVGEEFYSKGVAAAEHGY